MLKFFKSNKKSKRQSAPRVIQISEPGYVSAAFDSPYYEDFARKNSSPRTKGYARRMDSSKKVGFYKYPETHYYKKGFGQRKRKSSKRRMSKRKSSKRRSSRK